MESGENIVTEMWSRADQISRVVTELHGLNAKLGSPEAQREIVRALYDLTKQVEVVKKQLLRVQKGDTSTAL